MNESKTGSDILTEFLNEEKIFHFEGPSAIKNLNTVTKALGYEKQPFLHGSSFELFIQDNPGCCQAIIDWIDKHMENTEWKENMESLLPTDESECEYCGRKDHLVTCTECENIICKSCSPKMFIEEKGICLDCDNDHMDCIERDRIEELERGEKKNDSDQ